MSFPALGLAVLAIIAGALISLQAPINVMAGQRLGHVLGGATLSFVVGTLFLLAVVLIGVRDQIDLSKLTQMSPLLFLGGILGAFYVAMSIWLTPKLGIGAVISLGIAGQVVASLALDHFGLFNLAAREVTLGRASGAVLVVAGALMVRYL
ncbi:MAG: DMT family transporter [Hyphomicrobiaceae bacterium]|nr:DMT family transporter [Hyphomicrobiaceae bacterium]